MAKVELQQVMYIYFDQLLDSTLVKFSRKPRPTSLKEVDKFA